MFIVALFYPIQEMETKAVLPFATAWKDLEGIMLSEIGQRKTDTVLPVSSELWSQHVC